MKHLKSMLAVALVAALLPLAAHADPAHDAPAPVAHLVRSSLAEDVWDAEPGQLPSAAHREGTVFAIVNAPAGSGNIEELDVQSGAVLHRSSIVCSRILRAGARVFAMCSDEVMELDGALTVAARMTPRGCPAGKKRRPLRLAYDGVMRLVAAFTCDDVVHLRVMDSFDHRVLGELDSRTRVELRASRFLDVRFEGRTISGVIPSSPFIPATKFVVSADYRRIRTTSLPVQSQSYPAVPETVEPETVTPPPPPLPSGLGGETIDYELQLGHVRLFMTRACCGGAHTAGLYAAAIAR